MTMAESFRKNGYIIFRNAIPPERIKAARYEIHANLPNAMVAEQVLQLPTLKAHPALKDITTETVIAQFLHNATGGDLLPPEEAHVILRLPEIGGVRSPRTLTPHLDGTWNPSQEQRPFGVLHSFCAHLYIFLGSVGCAEHGAFHVWPASHLRVAHYIERFGLNDLSTARDGARGILSRLDLGLPLPITGEAGDVVLCHNLMAHSGSPNFGHEIRYGMVIRVRHQSFLEARPEQFALPFSQWSHL